MRVTVEWLNELAVELASQQVKDGVEAVTNWLEREEIDGEAIVGVFEASERAFGRSLLAGNGDVHGALVDVVGQAFKLGYEVSKRRHIIQQEGVAA